MEIKAKPKSFHYPVTMKWNGEKRGVLTIGGKPDLEVASPPEFRGHPGVWRNLGLVSHVREAEKGCLIAASILAKIEAKPEIEVPAPSMATA